MSDSDYSLMHQPLCSGQKILVLCHKESRSFYDEMSMDRRRREKAIMLDRAASRLARYGTDSAIEIGLLTMLHGVRGSLALYELHANARVYRIMTYVHNEKDRTPVLLFDFCGHTKRSAGGIPKKILRKGEELALVARELLEAEEEERNDSRRKHSRMACRHGDQCG